MKLKFREVGIYISKKDKSVIEIARHCCEVLTNLGVNVYTTNNNKLPQLLNLKPLSNKKVLSLDLLIVIGGDGSLLSAGRQFGIKGPPIIGINRGKLGFLADIPPSNLSQSLTEIILGNFIDDERFFLTSQINNQKRNNFLCLNEFVIHSGAVAKMIEFEVHIDERFVFSQRADGIIISTPTGSTAYSLSGGGPIVHPNVKAITLLPMFPHSLSNSPLLVDIESTIKITMLGNKSTAKLSMDSQDSLLLKRGDEIFVKKAEDKLTLLHPVGYDFYESCRKKLGWSSNITSPKI